MKDLIKITTNEKGQQLVSAKELYLGLGLDKSNWKRWSIKSIELNEFFKENIDWIGFVTMTNGNETKDYAISIEFAKHIAMMARTNKSHEYRNYFIECEKIAKAETNFTKYITEIDIAKAEISLMGEVAKVLNLNESSKLIGVTNIYKEHGISTAALPVYTNSKGVLKSATELLKKFNAGISATKFNKLMIEKGYLKELERRSTKNPDKPKKFKNLVNDKYGENQVNPKNPKETQPMYYEDKFEELLKELSLV